MSNFGVTPVQPETLLKMLQAQLQASGTPAGSNRPAAGLGDRAFLSLFDDKLHLLNPTAVQFVTIRPVNFPLWQSVVEGAGRDNTGFNGSVTFTCFIQMSADPEMKNVNAVSEDVLGVTQLVLKVLSAVQFWEPKDENGNDYLREYGRIATPGFRYIPVDGRDGPWVKVPIEYEMKFTALLPSLG